jgi:hypothetical protein
MNIMELQIAPNFRDLIIIQRKLIKNFFEAIKQGYITIGQKGSTYYQEADVYNFVRIHVNLDWMEIIEARIINEVSAWEGIRFTRRPKMAKGLEDEEIPDSNV